jgi:4-pyridoxate dehydrogenase
MATVESFDYVIVGAGSAGSVLAHRLGEDPDVRILVLEAGGPDRSPLIKIPLTWGLILKRRLFDWGYFTEPEPGLDDRRIECARGKVVGGCTSINGMAHARGMAEDYDHWAHDLGLADWSYERVLPYFKRSESWEAGESVLRGGYGPLTVQTLRFEDPLIEAFLAATDLTGHGRTEDYNGAKAEGFGPMQATLRRGLRCSAAVAYLRPALGRRNLKVEVNALTTRLVFEGNRAIGVEYVRDGKTVIARAEREVLLCGGVINSPQLLMLSGIGPAAQLRALGVDPVADVAGVGQNLQDHSLAMVSCASLSPLPASGYNHGEVYAALRSEWAGACPDLHLFPILLPLAPPGCQPPPRGYALAAAVVAPDSRGSVRLASADPHAAPLIDPGFLRDRRDTDRLEAGLRLIRQAAAGSAFSGMPSAEAWPGADVRTSAGLREFIRRTVSSYYHPAGTCRMGTGPGAVTDPQLRVRGVAGLRVADASVMPVLPNAHPNATVLAIAEKAAELLLDL